MLTLSCDSNSLTSLDLSAKTLLRSLTCINNQLTSLNIANGNNSNFLQMFASGNSNLSCIQIDTGFTPPTDGSWVIDATASYDANCPEPIVNIPDVNFKSALVNDTSINTNGDSEIQLVEALNYTSSINVSNESISDLTGIEAFSNITTLICSSNSLTSIDVSYNTKLVYLYCFNNELTSLDVSNNTQLVEFDARNNQLTNLNIANGENGNFLVMEVNNNPNLSCIKIDIGFTPPTDGTWIKDATANYNEDCIACLLYTSDAADD